MLLGCVCTQLGASELNEHRVRNLDYGRSLYHYFQNDNLGAITQLMIGAERPRNANQQNEANLLLADLYYDYGLYEESREIFAQVLTAEVSESIQSRIWFNLARLRYEQGYFDQARDLLSRISDELPAEIEAERKYMLSDLYLGNRQYQQAEDLGNQINSGSIWKVYSRYNLGVALIEDDHYEQGKPLLAKLGQMEAPSTELRALRDRANLSLGLKQLRLGLPEEALESLSRIRLEGPLSNQALLASGWALYRLDQFDTALNHWRLLIRRNAVDAATQEAILAIPANYAKSEQNTLAVRHYEIAIKQFDQQLVLLNNAVAAIENDGLIAALQENQLLYVRNTLEDLPPGSAVTPQLHILLASSGFQREIKRYQELIDIRVSLAYWGNSFPALELMLAERRQRFKQKLPLLEQSTSFEQLDLLDEQRERFAEEVNAIALSKDYMALATPQEEDHLERLQRVATSIVKVAPERNTAYQQDMFRLLSGLLHFEMETEYPLRFWKAKKQLILLDRALLESRQRASDLSRIAERTAENFGVFQGRIAGRSERIHDLRGKVDGLIEKQEQHINQLAVDEIRRQQLHIVQLRLNARYELAKLYDKLAAQQ
ncbi:MAG: tetratricopeptide repeat protein [Gammaproteobacteria bacterium]|nr:tetratricopeptide repeat protein [Gammaproteobacteria bacterium]